MRVLLDTNIIIHREASTVKNQDIGMLFYWLDKLHYTKCVHPVTIEELQKHSDAATVRTFQIKLGNYNVLKSEAPLRDEVKKVSGGIDINQNDINDTKLLNELYDGRVDILISEDKKIHTKAAKLGIGDKVYRIDSFLEKVVADHPELQDYKVLAIKKVVFGSLNLQDPFFDSFKADYDGFEKWFKDKSDETTYVSFQDELLSAFLFLKVETEKENYSNITPLFTPKKRLKIGTFKVTSNGYKLGERFLKIIFDNARRQKVEEIYVTIFDKRDEQIRLIELLKEWGFKHHGTKTTSSGTEQVFVRNFEKNPDKNNPKLTYPYLSREADVYFVPIRPEYHTELFPDSKLKTESAERFKENAPHRNAISKSYIAHSHERNLQTGDIIVFYMTGGIYKGVATTIGVVENVINPVSSFEELKKICRKRTPISEEGLKEFWDKYKSNKPFVVHFLYAYSFKRRPNLLKLVELGVVPSVNEVPRGFSKISWDVFIKLVKDSGI